MNNKIDGLSLDLEGAADTWNLRTTEQPKIHCGEQHFKALENNVALHVAKSWNAFKLKN